MAKMQKYVIPAVSCLLLICTLVSGQEAVPGHMPAGEGYFLYDEYPPLAHRPVGIHYYIPETGRPGGMPVLFLIHGAGRDARPLLNAVKEKLDEKKVIGISLEIPDSTYKVREFQEVAIFDAQGELNPDSLRTTNLVDHIYLFLVKNLCIPAGGYDIYGHSAGGQFIHRLLLFHESPYLRRAMIGSPGWYTFPDPEQEYPYGLRGTREADIGTIEKFLQKEAYLHLGTADTSREGVLRKTPEADAQGRDRLDRGLNFFAYLQRLAEQTGTPLNWQLVRAEGMVHDSARMALLGIDYLYG